MKVEIVIAHYHERLDWLSRLTDERIDKVYVYTKGRLEYGFNKSTLKNSLRLARTLLMVWTGRLNRNLHHRFLPNIGREAHTYLHHCAQHYERLKNEKQPRCVLFLQGHPHLKDVGEIYAWIDHMEKSGSSSSPNYVTGSAFDYLGNGKQEWWRGSGVDDSGQRVDQWARLRLGRECDLSSYPIYWNACFGVLSDGITSRRRGEYTDICSKDLSTRNPEAAYFLERLWYYWFNLDQRRSRESGSQG